MGLTTKSSSEARVFTNGISIERTGDVKHSPQVIIDELKNSLPGADSPEKDALAKQVAGFQISQFEIKGGEPYAAKISKADRERLAEIAPGLDIDSLEQKLETLDFHKLNDIDNVLGGLEAVLAYGGIPALITVLVSSSMAVHKYLESQGAHISPREAAAGNMGIGVAIAAGIILGTDAFRKMSEQVRTAALKKNDAKLSEDLNDALRSEGIVQ